MSSGPPPTTRSQDADHATRADRLGLCEWFHYGDHTRVAWAADTMRRLGVRHIRTGISWADFHRPDGPAWIRYVLDQLADFELLGSIWCTPPSISENDWINGPPRRLKDFGDFVGQAIDLYGDRLSAVELWNEPNGRFYWDFVNCDPQWEKFAEMVRHGGAVARSAGMFTVLGGLAPADPTFIGMMRERGVLEVLDAVSVHGFPMMWGGTVRDTAGGSEFERAWDEPWRWRGWADRLEQFAAEAEGLPVWITETGYATFDLASHQTAFHREQSEALQAVAQAEAPRIYWYALQDLHPSRSAIEGDHVEELEYHLGLFDHTGQPKPALEAFRTLMQIEPQNHSQSDSASCTDLLV